MRILHTTRQDCPGNREPECLREPVGRCLDAPVVCRLSGNGRKSGVSVIAAMTGRGQTEMLRTVLMVLFDEVQSLDVTGPLEVFTGANTWRTYHGDSPAYDIRTASIGGRAVRTSSGLCARPTRTCASSMFPSRTC